MKKDKSFWVENNSPKFLYEEFIKKENPEATFWDVFLEYGHEERKGTEPGVEEFDYPLVALAFSDTFFGLDDAGHLSYEEQEKQANFLFEDYKKEISELIGLEPDKSLQPEPIKTVIFEDDKKYDVFADYTDKIPFSFDFEGGFCAWESEGRVLFISLTHEDKELPYQIYIGGLDLKKYLSILNPYNEMLRALQN